MQTQTKIERTMTIDDILGNFPQKAPRLAQELTNTGLHCVGCHAATWETLEAGMLSHGYADKEIDALVERLNTILAEASDSSTISLTPTAAEKFREILEEEGKVGHALRFGEKAGGCNGLEYILDFSEKASDKDTVFESHGVQIHVMTSSLKRLMGCQIDYAEGLMGAGFKVMNPNVKSACGCGHSHGY